VPQGNVTMVEAVRISTLLALPLDDVVTHPLISTLDRGLDHSDPQPIPLAEGEVLLFLRLKRNTCIFLHNVGNRGFCSIYAARPGICRIYPFHVEYDGVGQRVGNESLCPVKWVQDDALRSHVATEMERWKKDERAEISLLKAWRADAGEDRSWNAFYRFSVHKLQRHLGINAEDVLRPTRPRRLGQATQ